jgi:FtsH-binding integral membrane protein
MAKEEKQKDVFWAASLAWLIPGAGHWYLGDRKRAVIYFVAITLTFGIGILIGGAFSTVNLQSNTAWFFAEIFAGGYTLLSLALGNLPGAASSYGKTLDLATIYAGVAGLLNLLVIFDAMDRTFLPQQDAQAPETTGGAK